MTTTDETTAKPSLRDLNDKLHALVPCPSASDGEVSPEAMSRHWAAESLIQSERFTRSMYRGSLADPFLVPAITGNYAAARLAIALFRVAPAAAAAAVTEIRSVCEMGESDEMAWDLLGEDAAEVCTLARQIAEAIEAVEASR